MADGKRAPARRSSGQQESHRVRVNGASASTEKSGSVAKAETLRVLVVDDVEDNRDLYATYFEHWGFIADQACDGEEALAKIAKRAPDVVIIDLTMPNMDGWEATRLIKSNPRTAHVIVVVVTAAASTTHLDRARAAGADEICMKPCLPKALLEIVQARLSRRQR
ncbi:MAG TPA: response regulator [Labilithrix sp.]|nr:response regulator [Labilithrix sp.]